MATDQRSTSVPRKGLGRISAAIGRGLMILERRPVRSRWASMFGVMAMASLAVLIITGLMLTYVYTPSGSLVIYRGSHLPLRGVEMSRAFESVLRISFDIPGGLLIRQAHHWAALLMPAALTMQLLITFFTGLHRRPHRRRWVLLFVIFVLALAAGWSGYALPDDTLSGTGLRIVQGTLLAVPLIGTWLSMIVFGGEFPGSVVFNLDILHELIVPIALVAVIGARLWISLKPQELPYAGIRDTEGKARGIPRVVKDFGLFSITSGVIALMAGLMTVNPVWLYGPASPASASAGSQPDWYMGFLDGALRLMPGWEFTWLDRTWTVAVLGPLVVVSIFLGLVAVFPLIESRITGDRDEHVLAERPRDHPVRTGLGAAGVAFYGTLWAAASLDLMATLFHSSINGLIWFFRIFLFFGPVIAYAFTSRICLGLQEKDREVELHGIETGQIVREVNGGYTEVHRPLGPPRRPALTGGQHVAPPRLPAH